MIDMSLALALPPIPYVEIALPWANSASLPLPPPPLDILADVMPSAMLPPLLLLFKLTPPPVTTRFFERRLSNHLYSLASESPVRVIKSSRMLAVR